MNRRSFLSLFGAGVAGIALEQAIPLGRVWSFPKEIVIADTLKAGDIFSMTSVNRVNSNRPQFEIGDVVTVEESGGLIDPLEYFIVQAVTEVDCYLYPHIDLGSGLQMGIVPKGLLRPAPFYPTAAFPPDSSRTPS